MKNHEMFAMPDERISLNKLMGTLLPGLQQTAVRQKSFFVNDIPDDILINADKNIVSAVVANLLRIVSRNADNSCIRVSAKAYHNVVLMQVRDSNTCNNYAINASLSQVEPLIGKIGGFIDINNQRQKSTIIAFSFSNTPGVAA
jgi:hypothetical protein